MQSSVPLIMDVRHGGEEEEACEMMTQRGGAMTKLPPAYKQFQRTFRRVWEAYDHLGAAVHREGPLRPKFRELIKLGIAIERDAGGTAEGSSPRGWSWAPYPRPGDGRGDWMGSTGREGPGRSVRRPLPQGARRAPARVCSIGPFMGPTGLPLRCGPARGAAAHSLLLWVGGHRPPAQRGLLRPGASFRRKGYFHQLQRNVTFVLAHHA